MQFGFTATSNRFGCFSSWKIHLVTLLAFSLLGLAGCGGNASSQLLSSTPLAQLGTTDTGTSQPAQGSGSPGSQSSGSSGSQGSGSSGSQGSGSDGAGQEQTQGIPGVPSGRDDDERDPDVE